MQTGKRHMKDDELDFDQACEKYRVTGPLPEFGPYTRRPNLTEGNMKAWWDSKTPLERFAALDGNPIEIELNDGVIPARLVGFGYVGKTAAAIPSSLAWEDLGANERAILLTSVQKGWIDLGTTNIGVAE